MYRFARSSAWLALLILAGCASQKPVAPPHVIPTATMTTAPKPDCEAQQETFRTVSKAHDPVATTTALTRLIAECPASVTGPLRVRVSRALYEIGEDEAQEKTFFETLETLFEIGWTAETEPETDFRWLSLSQMHVEHGNLAMAQRVSEKITGPGTLLQMRVDRRFDAIVSANPAHFDIRAAIDRRLERLQAASVSAPRSLVAVIEYAQTVAVAGSYEQSLKILNEAAARGAAGYDDYAEQYPWLLTATSGPLFYTGRMDEMIDALRAAERAGAGTRRNVSFTINLADGLQRAGHAREALETFAKVGDTSKYGSLVLQVGIANAARKTRDVARADEALNRAGEYKWQSIRLYVNALLRAGRVDEAKRQVLELLELPYWRSQTLADFQNYRYPSPRAEAEEFAALRELSKIPEIHDAILRVGRIETFDFPPQ